MIIYKITNIINNKIYIGKTEKSLNKRWSGHIAKSRKNIISVLHNAILKYGKENFKIEEIDNANTKEELNKKEIYWINKLNSLTPNGYNITLGGTGGDTITNNPMKEYWIKKISGRVPWNKGKTTPEEIKKRISKTKKKYFQENPDKKINSGSFKPGFQHMLYGKKRERTIEEKIIKTRLKNHPNKTGYKTWEHTGKHVQVTNNINNSINNYKSIASAAIALNLTRIQIYHIINYPNRKVHTQLEIKLL